MKQPVRFEDLTPAQRTLVRILVAIAKRRGTR